MWNLECYQIKKIKKLPALLKIDLKLLVIIFASSCSFKDPLNIWLWTTKVKSGWQICSLLTNDAVTSTKWSSPMFTYEFTPTAGFCTAFGKLASNNKTVPPCLKYLNCISRVSLTLSCPMNLKLFPMDQQKCSLEMRTCKWFVTPSFSLWNSVELLSFLSNAPVKNNSHQTTITIEKEKKSNHINWLIGLSNLIKISWSIRAFSLRLQHPIILYWLHDSKQVALVICSTSACHELEIAACISGHAQS